MDSQTYASTVGQSPFATGRVVDWADSDEEYGELPIAAQKLSEMTESLDEEEQVESKLQTAKRIAREVLDISDSDYTKYMSEIKDNQVDNDGRLVLVSYSEEKIEKNPLPLKLQEIRGVVVDTAARIVVCAGSEYTERITVDKLDVIPVEGDADARAVRVHSKALGKDIDFFVETDPTTRAGFYSPGTNLKVFLHNGELRVITNRNLDPSGEHRGGATKSSYKYNEPFTDSFFKLIPKKKLRQLFPAGCRYSPFSYNFLLSTPSRATATRIMMPEQGYLTFIRKDDLWSRSFGTPDCPFKADKTEADDVSTFWVGNEPDLVGLREEDFEEFFTKGTKLQYNGDGKLPLEKKPSFNYRKRILTSSELSQLLFTISDEHYERSFRGEAVILTKLHQLEDGRKIFYSVRLQSPAYEWRDKLFEEKKTRFGPKGGDVYETYLDLLTQRAPPTIEMLEKRFPIYGIEYEGYGWSLEAVFRWMLKEGLRCFPLGHGFTLQRMDPKKMHFPANLDWEDVITIYFIFLMSPSRQLQAIGCYERYRAERSRVADFLTRNYFAPKSQDSVALVKAKYLVPSIVPGKSHSDLFRFAMLCFNSPEYKASNSLAAREANRKLIYKLLNRNSGVDKQAILSQAVSLSGTDAVSAEELHRQMMMKTSLYKEGVLKLDLRAIGINLRGLSKKKDVHDEKKQGEYKRTKTEDKAVRPSRNKNFRPNGRGK